MKKITALILVLTLLLCGCGGDDRETTVPTTLPPETTAEPTTLPPETTEEPTTVPTTVATEPPPVDVNVLTGEELEEVNSNRIVAVMLNNHSKALPQCGISQADIIYEILAEGSTTRFMALFTDVASAGPIGPVRSLRPYYLNIMRGYNAICTSAGGSREADNMIYNLGYNRVNGISGSGANYFYRDSWRRNNRGYEHSLFITGEDLFAAAQSMGFNTTEEENADYGLTFTEETMTVGEDISQIVVHFYSNGKTTKLTYQSEEGIYTAYQQGADLVDGNTDEPVPFKNVLVLEATSYVKDGEGHLSVQTTGEGTGWYARDGKLISIKWVRESDTSDYEYYDMDGNPISFGVGKSYIAIIPEGSGVDFIA